MSDGPWSPGLTSTIPAHLMPRVTLFDPANSSVTWAEAQELSRDTGLKPEELASFRPSRLALHQVLIRVTCDTHVPDGPNYADLGINLRRAAADILETAIYPNMQAIERDFDAMQNQARGFLESELEAHLSAPPAEPRAKGLLRRLFAPQSPMPVISREERAQGAIANWTVRARTEPDPLKAASCAALARVLGAVMSARGSLHAPTELLLMLATNLVGNDYGSTLVGQFVHPYFEAAARDLGILSLPPQTEPVVLNAKGASASGKSSIRAQQRKIAEQLGIDWQEFAVISPDYWRKALIDYDSLGADYKYAAMLTGRELEFIDRQLDRYMAHKADTAGVPHMLIDRFRFDSFQTGAGSADSSLLSRHGARIYMFFLVTPPEETVTRAWKRGLETGRYKAVDDLLYHNVEAYDGMPDLFFSWAKDQSKWVHYEFLDNSVPQGQVPRSIAFGANGDLVIADPIAFCDIARFAAVNIEAQSPSEVRAVTVPAEEAMAVLRRAISELNKVTLLVPETAKVFAASQNGVLTIDPERIPNGLPIGGFGEHVVAQGEFSDLPQPDKGFAIGR